VNAGNYSSKFIWLKQSSTIVSGAVEQTFTSNGELWGGFTPIKAYEKVAFGLTGSHVEVRISIRNNVGISFLDRLQDKETGVIYEVDGVIQGDNQVVIDAHQFREQL
jgi:hypothetical protein